jgi:hypothetical protein
MSIDVIAVGAILVWPLIAWGILKYEFKRMDEEGEE